MTSVIYLAGPCEGMSVTREGLEIIIEDKSGREQRSVETFETEQAARAAIYPTRQRLYDKYEVEAVNNEDSGEIT
ncbi:MAG: hypothetical protein JWQ74_3569 [Marmoricola sp.]|nr:hypothetical protein [Marmoricola sp.]